MVNEVPQRDIKSLAADKFQPHTWYATTPLELFRSSDDGEGWQLIYSFADDEETVHIRVNNFKPGQIGVVTNLTADAGSRIYVSDDSGENWRTLVDVGFTINDLAWTSRDNESILVMATDNGLFELLLQPGASPVQISVDRSRPTLGFAGVAAGVGAQGTSYVAVAVRSIKGASVFLSTQGGRSDSYEPLGIKDENVWVLEVEQNGQQTFLWAGLSVSGGVEPGKGAARWELEAGTAGAHTFITRGWEGGSCHGLAFAGSYAFAATHDQGVLWLDMTKGESASWHAPLIESGLPIREEARAFLPVRALAAAAQPVSGVTTEPGSSVVMAGGATGIYRSTDDGTSYELCSVKAFHAKQ